MLYRKSSLAKIIALLAIVLAAGSCATNGSRPGDKKIRLKAEAVTEGIRLGIDNIPSETARIFINIADWGEKEEFAEPRDIVARFADIRGEALERIKADGEVVCPFVENGHSYQIFVTYEEENRTEAENWVFADCAAGGGVYFGGGPGLILNEAETALTLSAEPVFDAGVQYAAEKYGFIITIKKGEYWSIGAGNVQRGSALSWEFEPEVSADLIESAYLESGDHPAYATAYCNLVHDGVTWSVELAKSAEFTIRL